MARINLSVPNELKVEMEKIDINWSQVFCWYAERLVKNLPRRNAQGADLSPDFVSGVTSGLQ